MIERRQIDPVSRAALDVVMEEWRAQREQQHQENRQRLLMMEDKQDQHGKELARLSSRIDSLITLLEVGDAAMTVGKWIRKTLVFLSPFIAAVAFVYAYYLWLMGKGPFPH